MGWWSFAACFLRQPLQDILAPSKPSTMNPAERLMSPSSKHPIGTQRSRPGHFEPNSLWGTGLVEDRVLLDRAKCHVRLDFGDSLRLLRWGTGPSDHAFCRSVPGFSGFFAGYCHRGDSGAGGMDGHRRNWNRLYAGVFPDYSWECAHGERDRVYRSMSNIGLQQSRIITGHVIPNCLAPLIVYTTLTIGVAIIIEASLSFLGLGIRPPTPAWGYDLQAGMSVLEFAPHVVIFPGLAISITVLGFNMLGDGLRDALDPRLKT